MDNSTQRACLSCGSQLDPSSLTPVCSTCLLNAVQPVANQADHTIEHGTEPAGDLTATFEASSSVESDDAEAGFESFDDYIVLDEIARGGMGVVLKAREPTLDRVVAIKMILSGQFASDQELLRFYAEAESVARLKHKGIVGIHRVGEHKGRPYFAMEFVDGPTLARRIADGVFDSRAAAELMREVARAVEYAHQQGVVHRDLKPANILLADGSSPRITDFGLARRLDNEVSLTATGQILGTPAFMAPEQASGQSHHAGPATDIHAIGAILYCMLIGRPPFQSANVAETLKQVLSHEPAPLRQLNPDIPRDIETVCLKCLEKPPAARYETAGEVADELQRFLDGKPVNARPVSRTERLWRWARRNPVVSSLSVLLFAAIVGGFGGVLHQWTRAEGLATKESIERKRAEGLVVLEKEARIAATAAQEVAEAERDLAQDRLYANQIASLDRLVNVGETARCQSILESFRPTGQQRDLREFVWKYWNQRLSVFGGELYRHSDELLAVAVSPDGRRIATSGFYVTAVVDLEQRRVLWSKRVQAQFTVDLAFGPDGTWFLGIDHAGNSLAMFDTETGKVTKRITPVTKAIKDFVLSSDGTRLVTSNWDGEVYERQLASGQHQNVLPKSDRNSVRDLAMTPDGHSLAVVGKANFVIELDGDGFDFIQGGTEQFHRVAVSPDRQWLAVTRQGAQGNLILQDLKSGETTRFSIGIPESVEFSNDSRFLAAGDQEAIHVWDIGKGERIKKIPTGSPVRGIDFLDSSHLVTASANGLMQVWDVATDSTRRSERILKDLDTGPISFSPDGLKLAVGLRESRGIAIVDLATGETLRSIPFSGNAHTIAWSPDGITLAVSGDGTAIDKSFMALWNAESGELIKQWIGLAYHRRRIEFTASGEQIVSNDGNGDIEFRSRDGFEVRNMMRTKCSDFRLLDGDRMAILSRDGSVTVRSQGSNRVFWQTSNAKKIAANQGGLLAVATDDGMVTVWNIEKNSKLCTLSTTPEKMLFSPSGGTLVTLDSLNRKGGVSFWDLRTGELLLESKPTSKLGRGVTFADFAFAEDGRSLAASTFGNGVFMYHATE